MFWKILLLLFLSTVCNVLGIPKKYEAEDGGFSPSHRYYESDLAYEKSYKNKTTYIPQNPIAEGKKDTDPKESRFGAISYGTSGSGYGGNGVSYGTMKLDIGGVALGALIGLGAILIIPKISQIFAGGHGGYRRSLEEEMSSVTNMLSRIDNSLATYDIDSTSCTQRIICNFVSDAVKNEKAGEASSVDEFVLSLTKSSLFPYVMSGTSIKEAVEIGRSQDADKCSSTYSKCSLSREIILKVLAGLIPTI